MPRVSLHPLAAGDNLPNCRSVKILGEHLWGNFTASQFVATRCHFGFGCGSISSYSNSRSSVSGAVFQPV
ncbi:MAG: hypothetical protein CBC13_03635 [Planctomycetia bacterium TMED53]|nr:MAG: hypothetical protein CBC13_03635 [Planctomycetia bacterium TMED53]